MKLLLADSGIDPSLHNDIAFRCAAQNGHFKVVKFLLLDFESVAQLLLHDTRLQPHFENEDIPLFPVAAYNGHVEIVKLLFSWAKINLYLP